MINLEDMFYKVFGTNVEYLYKTPGRVNLIGEHLDYNGGTVLPCTISRYVYTYVSIRSDSTIRIFSTNFNTTFERSLKDLEYHKEDDWATYAFGVFYILKKLGYVVPKGLNILIDSTIPLASGLSSSAAFLDGMLFMLNDLFRFKISKVELIKIAKMVENDYCKVQTGIMDQASIMFGEKNKAILLNTLDLSYELVNVDLGEYTFVILQTNKERRLVDSKYNERVSECNKAIEIINKEYKPVTYLTELKVDDLPKINSLLPEALYRRVKHIVTEQQRVFDFVKALENKDIMKMGELFNSSHESLKNDYEVTGVHLDTITELAKINGAVGARMTGAGFGGCAVCLLKKEKFNTFKEKVLFAYHEKTGLTGDIYTVDIMRGPKKMQL